MQPHSKSFTNDSLNSCFKEKPDATHCLILYFTVKRLLVEQLHLTI